MNKIVLIIVLLTCMASNTYSQNLLDSVIEVKHLIDEDHDDEAETMLSSIEKQCQASGNDSILVLFYENKGVVLWKKEKFNECIPYFHKVIDLYERLNIRAQNYLDAFMAIGYSYGRLKDYDNAEKYYRKAMLKSVAAECNDDFRPNVYQNLGNLYMAKGDTILAKECYKRVGSEDAEDLDFMAANYLEWESEHWKRINKLQDEKKYEEAAKEYVGFIKGIKVQKGDRDESYLLAIYSYGILLSRYLNRIDEAIPLFKELVDMAHDFNEAKPEICGAYCNLALCYSRINNHKALDELIPNGLEYLQKVNSDDYPPHMIYRFAGNGAYWQQNYTEAIRYYEKYVDPKYPHEAHFCYEEIVNQLSISYIFSGMHDKAKTILCNLLDASETKLKKYNTPLLASVYHNLGRAYMLGDDKVKALKYLSRSSEIQMKVYGQISDRTTQYINECKTK